ncbi:capsule biosynthesis protein CapA [Staphylococcus pseudintermedius]|uniref:Wzz/FepE/Etk N-terminal domain-containing protein n=1 Tax=Staphylococcus pseudintermedius TaxID=283734 RepID=UPI0007AE3BC8|nr:Wzz/FepE/Etk N-terminal domain-containing protein [Staphylococcus pseudintermedius]EGQ1625764.1 capsule biosynthesis protein CapA [Staphylococcus pseudintermedius]EGQ1662122.1 capsule biosynthesis protein CapA [Staphylococcus pseudintermedius]EGQ2816761.1 capsule biosynthesis protein CapA [Staphylococcus pseudintermedius]EGQ3526018.1 capsule biosynthesis protein CapA [Staphylococcus pseudintermedius]EGQ3547426.1 capsule biosynthesis protein CapA [Staphylococcus pseudintermedius]
MEQTIDLGQLLKMVKKNMRLLIALPILFLVLSAVLTFWVLTPKYEASTQILVNQKKDESAYDNQVIQNNLHLVNTYSEILKSPRILNEVSKKYHKQFSYDELSEMINVTNSAESQIINISVTSSSPSESENLANMIAKVYADEMPNIMNIDNVSILSKAVNDAEKVAPKTGLNLIIGLLLGIVVAILIILTKELLDTRVKTEEDVEEYLKLPVLGAIEKY